MAVMPRVIDCRPNSSCSTITYNDDGGTSANFRISRSVTAGTYYVAVRHYDSTSGTGSRVSTASSQKTAVQE